MAQPPSTAPLCAAPDPSPKSPRLALPPLACDTHMHLCGPASRYAYLPERIYTPPDTLLDDYLHVANTLGLERVVFVQPSVYGDDNAAMLDAMQQCPLENRGVAVLDQTITDAALAELDGAGVRGIRFNLVDVASATKQLPVEPIRELANKIEPFGWHIELLIHVDDYPDLDQILGDLPVNVVVGHLGYFRPNCRASDKGFQTLLRLMQSGRFWAKLTGPYRISREALPYPSVDVFAKRLVQEAPERVLWGSDWPHVMVKTTMPNDGDLLDLLFDWVPDSTARRRILVHNAAELYGF